LSKDDIHSGSILRWEDAPDTFWTFSRAKEVLFFSHDNFCGISLEQLLGGGLEELQRVFVPGSYAAFEASIEKSFETGENVFDVRLEAFGVETKQVSYFICHFLPTPNADGKVFSVQVITHEITENLKRLEELEQSQERYRDLVVGSRDVIWESDEQGNWTFLNPAVRDILGYEPEEMIGRPYFELITPDNVEYARKIFREQADSKEFREFETRFIHKSGHVVYLSFNIRVIWDAQGNIVGRRGTARDISSQRALAEYSKSLGTRLAKLLETGEIYSEVIGSLKEAINPEGIFIFDRQDDRIQLVSKDTTDPSFTLGDFDEPQSIAEIPILRWTAESHQPWWIKNLGKLSDEQKKDYGPRSESIQSLLAVPIVALDRVIGFIYLAYFNRQFHFSQYEIQLAMVVAAQTAIALERTRFYSEKLENDRWYRELAENVNDIIFRTDYRGEVIYVTPSVTRILGYGQKEFITYFSNLLTEQKILDKFNWTVRWVRDGGTLPPFEIEIWHKEGRKMRFEINEAPVRGPGGQVIGVMGAMRNISESSRLKEALDRITSELTTTTEIEDFPVQILKLVNDEFNFDSCSIYLLHDSEFIIKKMFNYTTMEDAIQVPLGALIDYQSSSSMLRVLRDRVPWAVERIGDISQADDIFGYRKKYGDGAMFIAPLIHKDTVVGALTMTNYEQTRTFLDAERRIFASLALQAGGALERIELFDKQRERVKELTCLLSVVRNAERFDNVEDMLIGVCNDVLSGMRFVENARSRIEFDGQVYYCCTFKPMGNRISAPIIVEGEQRGFLEVYYCEEDRGFIDEEKQLIIGVAEYLGQLLERMMLRTEVDRREKLATLGSFARVLAHEIKNPLNAMQLSLVLLERQVNKPKEVLKEKVIDAIQILKEEIKRLDNLVEEYLLLGKGHILTKRKFPIGELFEGTENLLRNILISNNVHFETKIDPLIEINADLDKLKQVFINLIKNAIEAMPYGGMVKIESKVADSVLTLSVIDNGMGIPDTKRVFEPFYTTKATGTGLGLPIVREILNHHGGELQIDSQPGSGSTIRVILPIDE
jgi:PAS domain S-box-containing protein